jgi:FKBP-type peptidyl-prolyl cis-trans isomerase FkpA
MRFVSRGYPIVALLAVMLTAAACGGDTDSPTSPTLPGAPFSQTDLRAGTGTEAVAGRMVAVNYALWLYDPAGAESKGRHIESNQFAFQLGTGRVIPGWDRGLVGMRVGGLRRLVIPPDLAYGAAGSPPAIPGNATLVFDVELLNVQ